MARNSPGLTVAFVGSTGFPYRIGAEISKQSLLARGLAENNCRVIVVNRRGYQTNQKLRVSGHFHGVAYTNASGIAHRPDSLLIRNIYKIKGLYNELFVLKRFRANAVVISSFSFLLVLHYWMWHRIIGYRIFMTWVEYGSQLKTRNYFVKRINDHLFERFVFIFLHGIFPISDMLKKMAFQASPNLPALLIPTTVDFSVFSNKPHHNQDYFIYCGNTLYDYTIDFILRSFEMLDSNTHTLVLVLYGENETITQVMSKINISKKKDLIKIYCDINYGELVNLYINARAMLIPLKQSLQDEARFPHKIGEYTASGNPIITTRCGVIVDYFVDMENAYVATGFDPQLFSNKMQLVIDNPADAKRIGLNGNKTGRKYFDHTECGRTMKQFIMEVIFDALN